MASSQRLLTPLKLTKALTWTAIGTNIYVFANWNFTSPPKNIRGPDGKIDLPAVQHAKAIKQNYMQENYVLSSRNIEAGRYSTLITSAFSHQSLGHLGINMFMLHQAALIGSAIGLGPIRLAAVGLGSALGGSFGSLYDDRVRARAGEPQVISGSLGASGMVQGMLVATACAAPRIPMNLMFIPIPVPYAVLVTGFVGWDMYKLWDERQRATKTKNWKGSYVGYAAHLGGAASGALFYVLAMRRGRLIPLWRGGNWW